MAGIPERVDALEIDLQLLRALLVTWLGSNFFIEPRVHGDGHELDRRGDLIRQQLKADILAIIGPPP